MPPFNKFDKRQPREKEFKGYYVDVTRAGGDAIKAYRKLKRMYKETNYFEEMRDREYYQKPSEVKRETRKNKAKVLRKLQRERDGIALTGRKNRR